MNNLVAAEKRRYWFSISGTVTRSFVRDERSWCKKLLAKLFPSISLFKKGRHSVISLRFHDESYAAANNSLCYYSVFLERTERIAQVIDVIISDEDVNKYTLETFVRASFGVAGNPDQEKYDLDPVRLMLEREVEWFTIIPQKRQKQAAADEHHLHAA